MLRRFVLLIRPQSRINVARSWISSREQISATINCRCSSKYSILNSLLPIRTKVLKFYFGKFYHDSHNNSPDRNNNFTLLSSNFNEALIYCPPNQSTDMASRHERSRSRSPVLVANSEEDITTFKEDVASSPDIGTSADETEFEILEDSYLKSRQTSSNLWLDIADKSCYIYLYRGGGDSSESMAAFDLDGTLIKPKSNRRIPKGATDWDFFSVWTKVKVQQAVSENQARFVIFTNQYGIGLNMVPLSEVQERIELVTRRLDLPCTVFMATRRDGFRKPRTGMFQLLVRSFNNSIKLNLEKSFYVGDAIGYPSHSDADIKFAQRLSLPFLTPEKFVRGVKPKLV